MRYRVRSEVAEYDAQRARDMQEKYGLTMFSIPEIISVWRNYSDEFYAAGWIGDDKVSVEAAFGVVLEPVPGTED